MIATVVFLMCCLLFTIIYFRSQMLKISKDKDFQISQLKKDLELGNIRNALSQSRSLIEDIEIRIRQLKDDLEMQKISMPNESTLIKEELISNCLALRDSRVENFLNIYESACTMYLNNPEYYLVFKSEYYREIKNIVESDYFSQYFNAISTNYHKIVEAYKKWEKDYDKR